MDNQSNVPEIPFVTNSKNTKKAKKPVYKKWWFYCIVALLIIGAVRAANSRKYREEHLHDADGLYMWGHNETTIFRLDGGILSIVSILDNTEVSEHFSGKYYIEIDSKGVKLLHFYTFVTNGKSSMNPDTWNPLFNLVISVPRQGYSGFHDSFRFVYENNTLVLIPDGTPSEGRVEYAEKWGIEPYYFECFTRIGD
ncbi:MAG: hypothetical protein IJL41_04455 [Clostridia bacterium]|nr:hypothetical protein [Clostridia bacterium]